MPGLYKSSGYNLDRMELIWMQLEACSELINEEDQKEENDAQKILSE